MTAPLTDDEIIEEIIARFIGGELVDARPWRPEPDLAVLLAELRLRRHRNRPARLIPRGPPLSA